MDTTDAACLLKPTCRRLTPHLVRYSPLAMRDRQMLRNFAFRFRNPRTLGTAAWLGLYDGVLPGLSQHGLGTSLPVRPRDATQATRRPWGPLWQEGIAAMR
jgi:hypothetical protein